MSFIADVVYGLKQEYGKPVTLKRDTTSFDPATGTNTITSSVSQQIPLVIFLPLNMRQAFFKAINMQSELYLKPGEQQMIVDLSDTSPIPDVNDYFLDQNNLRYDITRTENIGTEAMVVTSKQI